MRLFVAVNCDGETKSRLLLVRDRIRAQAEKGVFSRSENLHLTLAFLGETPPDQVPVICSALSVALRTPCPVEPFSVCFSRTDCFRRGGKELWWTGAEGEASGLDALTELRRRIVHGLEAAGVDFDRRPFKAHITLGREIKHSTPVVCPAEPIDLPVRRLSLMRSEHINRVLTYTEIFGEDLEAARASSQNGLSESRSTPFQTRGSCSRG